ncbi:hypothetical protein PE066_06800 [Ramlibacter tataouinensis]|uniref:hypothetical protein n=1 Tax=Ramlibacter tataouinensis TaxID=94132 RepID=UPI0022F3F14A|nr:hypothetical protein [Ramlibacter tataouinensis]WBY03236.1 hypothetical protein PE066_06800 [Ramlibacter tataouinensis]
MRPSPLLKGFLTFAAAATLAGGAAAQARMGYSGQLDPSMTIYGQQNSWQAPMGETGSPHGDAFQRPQQVLGASEAMPGSSPAPDVNRMGAGGMGAGWMGGGRMGGGRMGPGRNPDQPGELNFVGQQSTHHTPMGETGTPHGHQ